MKINIYATNIYGHNVDDAKRFLIDGGEIIAVTEGRQNIFNTDSQLRHIESVLEDMKPQDYLLIAGNAVVAGMITALVCRKFGYLKLLIWDGRIPAYVERLVKYV